MRDGEFKTVACDKHSNGSSAFYALYVAGESGEVECNVYGGEFTSISKVAAFVGNSNDGGDKEEGASPLSMAVALSLNLTIKRQFM